VGLNIYREPSRLQLNGWSWTFSLCSPLPTACPALNAIHQEYSCNWPGSAGICQQWYYDGQPRRICNAASSLPPTSIKAYRTRQTQRLIFQPFSSLFHTKDSGSNDYGFVMRLEPNAIVLMICDPNNEPEFLINNDVGANFTIRHCSACATDDAKWCGPQYPIYNANMFATIAKDNESPSYLSLNQLPGEMTASEPVPSTFRLSGLFQTSPRAIISFLISGSSSNGSIAHAKISFPAPDTAVLTVTST
jgi:hypothetical protein